jgi:formylglycine-generating enzyme required for sulfatase activity
MENVSGVANIIIVTNSGIYESYKYISESSSSTLPSPSTPVLDCSGLLGGDWLPVLGNPILGTSDFCVMKYEAKNNGGNASSVPVGTPWVSINQTDARIACLNLGTGYKLITDPEWVTIARIAENDNTNWNSSVVGTGGMFRGNVNLNDGISCGSNSVLDGVTDGTNCLSGSRNKRTLNISGALIWDLGGNVWEWTNDTLQTTGTQNSSLGVASSNWYEWDNISGYNYLKPSDVTLNATKGIGKVYADTDAASPSGTIHGFLRGGTWGNGPDAGAFALGLDGGPSNAYTGLGLRCSYAP